MNVNAAIANLESVLTQAAGFVWGPPLVILLVGTGLFLKTAIHLIILVMKNQ